MVARGRWRGRHQAYGTCRSTLGVCRLATVSAVTVALHDAVAARKALAGVARVSQVSSVRRRSGVPTDGGAECRAVTIAPRKRRRVMARSGGAVLVHVHPVNLPAAADQLPASNYVFCYFGGSLANRYRFTPAGPPGPRQHCGRKSVIGRRSRTSPKAAS